MITINRESGDVRISFKISTSVRNEVSAVAQCGDQLYAELLTQKIRSDFESMVEAIRREEYHRGWKDAKAKRRKEKWFSDCFRLIHA